MSSRDFKYRILLDANPEVVVDLTQKFKEAQASAEAFNSSINIGLSVNLWEVGFRQLSKFPAALAAAADRGKDVAREMTNARRELELLSGGASMASTRINELTALADHPNWQMPGLVAGTQTLDKLTAGALSSGRGLQLVADVAAGLRRNFEQLAPHIGNAYNALMSGGRSEGALQQLVQMGAISAETQKELLALQAAGKQGPEVWAVLEQSLSRFNGQLDALRQTSEGAAARLDNVLGQVLGRVMQAYLAQTTQSTNDLADALEQMDTTAIEHMAEQIGTLVSIVQDAAALLTRFGGELVFVAKMLGGLGLIVASRKFAELAGRTLTAAKAKLDFNRTLADEARRLGVSRTALLAQIRDQERGTAATGRGTVAKQADTAALAANTAATNANTTAKVANARASGAAAVSSALPVGGGAAARGAGAAAGTAATAASVGRLTTAFRGLGGALAGVGRSVTALLGGPIGVAILGIMAFKAGVDWWEDRAIGQLKGQEDLENKLVQQNTALREQLQTLTTIEQLAETREATEKQLLDLEKAKKGANADTLKIIEMIEAQARGRLEIIKEEGEEIVAQNAELAKATAEEKRRNDEIAKRIKHYEENHDRYEKEMADFKWSRTDDEDKVKQLTDRAEAIKKDFYGKGNPMGDIDQTLARLSLAKKSWDTMQAENPAEFKSREKDYAEFGNQMGLFREFRNIIAQIDQIQARLNQSAKSTADRDFARQQLEDQLAIDRERLAGNEEQAKLLEHELRLKREVRDIVAQTGLSEANATELAEKRLAAEEGITLQKQRQQQRVALEDRLAQYAIQQARLAGNEQLAQQWEDERRIKKDTLDIMERMGLSQAHALSLAKGLYAQEKALADLKAAGEQGDAVLEGEGVQGGSRTTASGKREHYVDGEWLRPEDMTSEQRARTGTSTYVRDGAEAVGMEPGWMDTAEDRMLRRGSFAAQAPVSLSASLGAQMDAVLPMPTPAAQVAGSLSATAAATPTGEKISQAAEGAAAKLEMAEEKTAAAITQLGVTLGGRFDAIARELAQLNARVQDLHNN